MALDADDAVGYSSDYHGAQAAGMHALLLRRPGREGKGEHKEEGEVLTNVEVVNGLQDVVHWVAHRNDIC